MASSFKKMIMMANQIDDKPSLPKEYVQLEWLGSDSSAYIDTAVITNDNTLLNLDFYVGKYVQYGALFGNYITESENTFRVIFGNGNHHLYFNVNTRAGSSASASLNIVNASHTLTLSKSDGLKIDGLFFTPHQAKGNENRSSLALFNNSVLKPVKRDIGLKVYSCQIYDGDVIIRDFIPALRITDSKPGMYDLVSGQFLTNQGKGEFTY